MAEVEFEENCAEIKDYLNTVRECKQYITQIPTVLKKLLELLNTSTALLEDLCTFVDAPDSLQQQCMRSRHQMITFYEGSALKSLTDSIQDVVHQRLQRMEEISQEAYMECKRRRDARAKYLSDVNGKGPFNLAPASPGKLQKHKEEYTSSDERYRQACDKFARYRLDEMGTAQRDFYSGYSGVFALLTNALNLPTDGACVDNVSPLTATTDVVNTRLRVRRQLEQQHHQQQRLRPSRSLRVGAITSRFSPRAATTAAVPQVPAPLPPPTPLVSEESHNYQRRLSDGVPVDKPTATATTAADVALRRTSSARSGDVVNGIPMTPGDVYGDPMYEYVGTPIEGTTRGAAAPPSASAERSPVPVISGGDTSSHNSGASGSTKSSTGHGRDKSDRTSSTPHENASFSGGARSTAEAANAPARKSSSTTLNHFSGVSPDTAPLEHEYSLFNAFEMY